MVKKTYTAKDFLGAAKLSKEEIAKFKKDFKKRREMLDKSFLLKQKILKKRRKKKFLRIIIVSCIHIYNNYLNSGS